MSTTENKSHIPGKEQVRKLLQEAFPRVEKNRAITPLSHNECIHLRSRLSMLSDKDLPIVLCQVLEDLLDTHTGQLGRSQDAEAVVQYLNVLVHGTDLET